MLVKDDVGRVSFAVGLISVYIAFITLYSEKFEKLANDSQIGSVLFTLINVWWGLSTVILVIYVFLQMLELKYLDSGVFSFGSYRFKVSQKLKRIIFDEAIDQFVGSVSSYALIYILPYSLFRGYLKEKPILVICGYTIYVALVLLFVAILEKRFGYKKKPQKY